MNWPKIEFVSSMNPVLPVSLIDLSGDKNSTGPLVISSEI